MAIWIPGNPPLFALGCRGLSPENIKVPSLEFESTLETDSEDEEFNPVEDKGDSNIADNNVEEQAANTQTIDEIGTWVLPSAEPIHILPQQHLEAAIEEAMNSSLIKGYKTGSKAMENHNTVDVAARRASQFDLRNRVDTNTLGTTMSWDLFKDAYSETPQEGKHILPSISSGATSSSINDLTQAPEAVVKSPSLAEEFCFMELSPVVSGLWPEPLVRNWESSRKGTDSPAECDSFLHPSEYFLEMSPKDPECPASRLKTKAALILAKWKSFQ